MIIVFGKWGHGVTFRDIQIIISNYLSETNQQNLFKNGKPSKGWWYDFLNRHKALISLRKAGNISTNRAASCTKEIINKFFDNCKQLYDELKVDMNSGMKIWNSSWLCSDTCLPKKYIQGTELYCTKKCKV